MQLKDRITACFTIKHEGYWDRREGLCRSLPFESSEKVSTQMMPLVRDCHACIRMIGQLYML